VSSLAFVIVACSALAGSPHRDQCREIHVPVTADAPPLACMARGQEFVASHPEAFEGVDVIAFGCAERAPQANTGQTQ